MKRFNENAACPKCGNVDVGAVHCNDQYPYSFQKCYELEPRGNIREHIHRRCSRCHYEWLEAVLAKRK